jgi:hypothetical protein
VDSDYRNPISTERVKAVSLDAAYKAKALVDLEFSKFFTDEAFNAIVK